MRALDMHDASTVIKPVPSGPQNVRKVGLRRSIILELRKGLHEIFTSKFEVSDNARRTRHFEVGPVAPDEIPS